MNEVLIGSLLAGLATGVGAIPVLFIKRLTHKWRDILLAFAGGVMLAAALLSLIPEALEFGTLTHLIIGLILGALLLSLLENFIPHIHVENLNQSIQIDQKAMLVIAAITLHNIPEGLATGVSYASGQEGLGELVAIAIGTQNAPEGFLVALFLIYQKLNRFIAFIIATMTGLVEVATALLGFFLTNMFDGLVSYGLAFASGAMLFIIYKELIPESHGDGHERPATHSFIFGIILMVSLIEIF
ncbi:ZIP family metal transporter [Aquisalibacillus elongatus]|uniref:ZIP family zinc transporter n=1 Tax=Aquisalibacillus elongatus TaxID=485577 RepID=A0A3N5C2P4_9BACI|nr:ZIP family metal transporter [Aquisalibacillus elongatus]RPF52285.1 ZIP family zinc transporter [Aquisalibacillus elongatus]